MRGIRIATVTAALGLAACAPDAWNNQAAAGLNDFLDKISSACAPLQYGENQYANPSPGVSGSMGYAYWLDQTSRLYYRRISPQAYADSLTSYFGAGNQAPINCTLRYLPPA